MLINCPECNHQVSDKAATCPNCGIKIAGNPDITGSNTPKRCKSDTKSSGNGKNKSSRWAIIFFIVLTFVFAAAVGSYYLHTQMQKQDEEAAFQQAVESNNADELQRYLAHYGAAPQVHRDSVKAMLQHMRDAERNKEEQEQLDAIDSIDYALACKINTIDSYENYLRKYPKSKRIVDVKQRILKLASNNATEEEVDFARSVCRRFFQSINSHDTDQLLSTVPTTMTRFLNRVRATNSDVVTFMEKLYKPDVNNLNFRIMEPFTAKHATDEGGSEVLRAQFTATLSIDREDLSKERFSTYNVTADVTPDGLISRFNLKKVVAQATEYSE